MKKVTFENRHGVRKYILHSVVPVPVNIVEESDDGWTLKTDSGELLSPPFYNNKGDMFAQVLEGQYYKIEEDIGNDEGEIIPWDEDLRLYEKGMIVTLEGTEDEKGYIYDGWCNLYPRPDGAKKPLAKDRHPLVSKLFT